MGFYIAPTLEVDISGIAYPYDVFCFSYKRKNLQSLNDKSFLIDVCYEFMAYCMERPLIGLQICEMVVEVSYKDLGLVQGLSAEQVALGNFVWSLNSLIDRPDEIDQAIAFVRGSKPLQSIFPYVWVDGLTDKAKVLFKKMKVENSKTVVFD